MTAMKKQVPFLIVLFAALAALALYLAQGAMHSGNVALFIVLLVAAVIFWNRVQNKRT
jgi:hypothetical protein